MPILCIYVLTDRTFLEFALLRRVARKLQKTLENQLTTYRHCPDSVAVSVSPSASTSTSVNDASLCRTGRQQAMHTRCAKRITQFPVTREKDGESGRAGERYPARIGP